MSSPSSDPNDHPFSSADWISSASSSAEQPRPRPSAAPSASSSAAHPSHGHRSTKGRRPSPIAGLAAEQILWIFGFFTAHEIARDLAPVCREWRGLAEDPELWASLCRQVLGRDRVLQLLPRYQGNPKRLWLEAPLPRLDGAYVWTRSLVHLSGQHNAIALHPTPEGPIEILTHRYLRFLPDGQVLYYVGSARPDLSDPLWGPQGLGRRKDLRMGRYRINREGRLQVQVDCGHLISYMQLGMHQEEPGRHNGLQLQTFLGKNSLDDPDTIRFPIPEQDFHFETPAQSFINNQRLLQRKQASQHLTAQMRALRQLRQLRI